MGLPATVAMAGSVIKAVLEQIVPRFVLVENIHSGMGVIYLSGATGTNEKLTDSMGFSYSLAAAFVQESREDE